MSEDEQEARSRRYVDALRVVGLSSGRWGVFTMHTGECVVMEKLEETTLRGMLSKQAELNAIREQAIRERARSAKPANAGKVSISIEDLFS